MRKEIDPGLLEELFTQFLVEMDSVIVARVLRRFLASPTAEGEE